MCATYPAKDVDDSLLGPCSRSLVVKRYEQLEPGLLGRREDVRELCDGLLVDTKIQNKGVNVRFLGQPDVDLELVDGVVTRVAQLGFCFPSV